MHIHDKYDLIKSFYLSFAPKGVKKSCFLKHDVTKDVFLQVLHIFTSRFYLNKSTSVTPLKLNFSEL